jgi:GTPase SAR1 family protein
MKRVTIKYNPYLVTTQIKVDGQSPKPNSSLKVENSRLQEWVERLPQILMDEYRDTNFEIAFTGTQADFDDVVSAVGAFGNKVNIKCELNKTADIADAEATIDSIFEEIKKGPVTELKDPRIIEAFEKAKNSQFEINVVATMSSGKSTLINALLGKQLMPAANEATTATIVRIIDTDQEKFSADAYDKSHNKVKHIDDVTITDMKALNDDEKISFVTLKGHIPFVSSTGMRLVLVDTPGPNNSRDKRHEEMTYKMIADSDKSLVLYVMNGEQLGINDEKIFLDYVCKNMKEGGKQSRERFIFAVNRMDRYSVKTEGTDCVEKALNNVKEGLVERGIYNPNIFPVTALAALEKRTDDDEPMAIDSFRRNTNKYDTFHFENYYHYSHLPQIAHQRIDKWLEESEGDDRVEIHTGIVSIEQAISMYINKYARTTKVCDLVQSFKV